jgi:hypothetical protein
MTPSSFWNPECGWNARVPQQRIGNGYKNLIAILKLTADLSTPNVTRPEARDL